jgi:hypothetical protein
MPLPELQLYVFVFQDARRRRQLHPSRREHGLRISHAVGFQQLQSLKQLRRDLGQTQFRIHIENRIEVSSGQLRSSELIDSHAQFRDIGGRHGESTGVRVAAVAGEQAAA